MHECVCKAEFIMAVGRSDCCVRRCSTCEQQHCSLCHAAPMPLTAT
jgi:hypothetical protein